MAGRSSVSPTQPEEVAVDVHQFFGLGDSHLDHVGKLTHGDGLGYIFPKFASYQIASPRGKSYFLAHAKQTTGIATINQKVLAGLPFKNTPL
jgi:hypothetical protein